MENYKIKHYLVCLLFRNKILLQHCGSHFTDILETFEVIALPVLLQYNVYVGMFYVQLCVILEPMQELMSRHKAYALPPRDCLKTTLFQKWQRMIAPPGKPGSRTPSLCQTHRTLQPPPHTPVELLIGEPVSSTSPW